MRICQIFETRKQNIFWPVLSRDLILGRSTTCRWIEREKWDFLEEEKMLESNLESRYLRVGMSGVPRNINEWM
jgi:hypothetical protein